MPDLLFELGCEELPAASVRRAYTQLEAEILGRLDAAGIERGASQSFGTPRRLIVGVSGVADRQPDSTKESRGPAVKSAYGPNGEPTPALLGFCRAQGVAPESLRREDDYVWATRVVPGRSTIDVLAEALPESVRALSFDKSMRWGSSRMRFARPIRWIVAAFGGAVVPFEIEGVTAGLESRGHRFLAPEPFEASSLDGLLLGLRQRCVEPDPAVRERQIRDKARAAASGEPELSDALVDENVFLTEWPMAIEGSFPESFLELPDAVLVTAMAKHERFFPVRDAGGRLTNRFISIRNAGSDDVVRAGNEWVLNARFNDAKFFFDEDRKSTMDDFLARTARMTYQEKLGSVRQRADRLSSLAERCARWAGLSETASKLAAKAGLYCKADLSCGLVSELPALQGVIGGAYARRSGLEEPVCRAIELHYEGSVRWQAPEEEAALPAIVLFADQLDKLAGYLGLGLVPSGSSDPFGLRRAVTLLIEGAWAWPTVLPGYLKMLDEAFKGYLAQGVDLEEAPAFVAAADLFASRYDALTEEARHDLVEAATLPGDLEAMMDPQGFRLRLAAMSIASEDVPFVQTCTRPLNIVSAAEKKGVEYARREPLVDLDPEMLRSSDGVRLMEACNAQLTAVQSAVGARSAPDLLDALQALSEPINAFFESTMVMDEDPQVRFARLSLLKGVCDLLRAAGDFSKIVIAGG